jgi:Flp pilus assembly pilin Flp
MPAARWRERGVTSVEYALMAAIIALLLVAGVVALHGAVQERFERDAECAEQAYDTVGC